MGKAHSSVYRASDGRVWGKMFGGPVLLLNTTGRKSGQRRTTPLLYVMDSEDFVVIASNGGAPSHPAWYLNLRANPCVDIQQGDGIRTMIARTADGIEHAQLWERLVHQFPVAARYQRKTSRMIPVVILRPATP